MKDQFLETFQKNFVHCLDGETGIERALSVLKAGAVRGLFSKESTREAKENIQAFYKRISETRELYISEGKIGTPFKAMKNFRPKDHPFPIPSGWLWVNLESICCYIQRGKSPSYVEKSSVPVVSQKCVQWSGFDVSRVRFVDPKSVKELEPYRFLHDGDILWNSTGTGTVGRAVVFRDLDKKYPKMVVDSHVTVVRPVLVQPEFLQLWIASPYVQGEIDNMAKGMTNQVELNLSTVRAHWMPLPPPSVQSDILMKISVAQKLLEEAKLAFRKKTSLTERMSQTLLHQIMEP